MDISTTNSFTKYTDGYATDSSDNMEFTNNKSNNIHTKPTIKNNCKRKKKYRKTKVAKLTRAAAIEFDLVQTMNNKLQFHNNSKKKHSVAQRTRKTHKRHPQCSTHSVNQSHTTSCIPYTPINTGYCTDTESDGE